MELSVFPTLILVILCGSIRMQGDSECQEIQVPMCKGLIRYTHTKLPNKFGHDNQSVIFKKLEKLSMIMDDPCSNNFRALACGMYLPECRSGHRKALLPCKETCVWAKRECGARIKQLRYKFPKYALRCKGLKRRKSKKCIRPYRKLKTPSTPVYNYCEPRNADMCQGLPFSMGSLPNFFSQGNPKDVGIEMEHFKPLAESGCHEHVRLFVCGIYKPFCANGRFTHIIPCRSLCKKVRKSCLGEYEKHFPGYRWPIKFQCQRYPSESSMRRPCFKGNDTNPVWEQTNDDEN